MAMTDEWGTPQDIFDKLNEEFHFTMDVCALPHNAKCDKYYTPTDDGLEMPWSGTVWMNPPYGKAIQEWMRAAWVRAINGGATTVALVPTRTNAPWWHDFVMKSAEIRFIKKKISFVGLKVGVPFTGHAIVVFRPGVNTPIVSSFTRDRDAEGVR